jgi:hypothetical protein
MAPADAMQEWFEAGTSDGFTVVAPILPRTIDDFVDEMVPILQERGLVRSSYGDGPSTHAGLFGLAALAALDFRVPVRA